jgi:hypothetical protein
MRRCLVLLTVLVVVAAGCDSAESESADAGPETTFTDDTGTTTPPVDEAEAPPEPPPGEESTTTGMTTTTPTEAPTTTTTEPVDVQIVRESLAAWNTGDLDAYLAFFADDAIYLKYDAHSEYFRDGCEFWQTLGDRTVIGECDVWEDGRVRCHAVGSDNLSGPAGAFSESLMSFWVTDGKITRVSIGATHESCFKFVREMGWWLESAHPDVWDSTFALADRCDDDVEYNCWETWYATAETAAVLLEFGPEFIAQSDTYPLDE